MLKKTVIIILKHVYNEKKIPTSVSKRSLKKLILDTCQKAVFFTTKNVLAIRWSKYGWVTWTTVSQNYIGRMWKSHVGKLIEDDIITFYIRYADDTLHVIKRADISYILNKFNSLNDNLKFTIDTFENCVPHFLDIEICSYGLGIYYKHTQTGR